jgi:hypothetical protein
MKLYTEEQVLNSMLSMKTYIEKYDESVIDSIVEKHLKSLGGIELPSDEEIKKVLIQYNDYLFTFIDKDEIGINVETEDVIKWYNKTYGGGEQ